MKNFLIAVLLVFLSAVPPALAVEKPPTELYRMVTETSQLVHRGDCKFRGRENILCLIYFDEARQLIYLVLFNDKIEVTNVVAIDKDKKEHMLWQLPGV